MPRAALPSAFALTLSVGLFVVSCGKEGKTTAPTGSAAAEHAGHTGHTHAVLADGSLVDVYAPAAPNTTGLRLGAHASHEVYDESAPATVLITTRWGQGSGVIVDPKGLILTNYHIVEGGQREDFSYEVGVTLAKLNKDGSVSPGARLRAVALGIDARRDLALLRVIDPPGPLPAVTLGRADRATPGRAVSAIGNAGVGFGWAVKKCSINAVGTLENAVETLVIADAQALPKKQREALIKARRAAAKATGLLIQTDCNVLPGDSGGPLIDDETHELVGLNAALRTSSKEQRTLGTVSFHVHIREIRSFLDSAGEDPIRVAPDPWRIVGNEATLGDSSGDGEIDSLVISGRCGAERLPCRALFTDLDQDSFSRTKPLPPLQTIVETRAIDSEWAQLLRPRRPRDGTVGINATPVVDQMFYVDANNDGAFDRLIVVDGELNKTRGYRLDGWTATRDPSLDDLLDKPEKLFTNEVDRKRLAHFAGLPDHRPHTTRLDHTTALKVELADYDGDGREDGAVVQTRLDKRVLLDLDHNALSGRSRDDVAAALASKMVDAEIVVVTGTSLQVFYDTDDDGRFDLILEAPKADYGYAVNAVTIAPDGNRSPAPDHLGRRVLRPDLLQTADLAASAANVLAAAFPAHRGGPSGTLRSFPSPTPGPRFEVSKLPKVAGAILVQEPGRALLMVDLDGDAAKNRANKGRSLKDTVAARAFDAEYVLALDGTLAWAFYDTDNDGTFDQVWLAAGNAPNVASHVFSIGASVTRKDAQKGQTLFEPAAFRSRRLRRAFERVRAAIVE